ncbi:Dynamitin-domain-containing protein [Tricharina praecox]|uniref:Dynamitin-domain-containing protein n=1 Tax=Tricharina praecox TaxID=43433 RepID=UPI002220C692|nr:Dynamitin-domain-containing protein [Tricharina praecox]XP_051334968.1 Dynamitin-domain-containing protein [Tricharina praecox]KAI5840639.1 Dynamitin-domain-containing protein [Tricharina praecox]KAI5842067.1 Dynamitin-domain-containing protein [Tricharina praecox]
MESGTTSTYTVTYAPDYKKTHTLAKVAEFDDRITFLEKVLGMSALTLDADSDSLLAPAMIPHLEELSRQMTVLNSSTTSSLDSASRRVKQLTADTEKLAEARKAAKTEAVTAEEDDETTAKINALYGVLPTIESMKPLLPALLDRLRSLRAVHQDAARAAEILVAVEKRQEEMAAEILKWEETLGKVEEVVKTSGQTVEGNMVKVETWVREIEKKMEALR